MKQVLLRFDATKEIGMGHAIRIQSLIEALKNKIDMNLIICGKGEGIKAVFKDIDIYPLKDIDNIDYDVAIQDIFFSEISLKNDFKPLIVIDDFGGSFKANLILNGSVLAHKNMYKNCLDKTEFLCGGQFSLLRKAFLKSNQPIKKIYDLTIVAGSGIKASEWVTETLQQLKNFKIYSKIALIVGAQFVFPPNFEKLLINVDFYQSLEAKTLAHKLQQSRFALVTGGMIMYEAIALGVPIFVYPNVDNQLHEIDFFVKNNVTENLKNINSLEKYLLKTLQDKTLLQKRITLGQKLIDGYGAQRAADIIYARFFN